MTAAVARVTRTARVIISIIAPRRIDLRMHRLPSPLPARVKIPRPDSVSSIVYTPVVLPVSDRRMS